MDFAWEVIEAGVAHGGSVKELEDRLRSFTPEELTLFCSGFSRLQNDAFCAALWGAAYVIWGGCSSDGFDYFVGWLILQGRGVYEAALQNPDSLAVVPGVEGSSCEEVVDLPYRVYSERTGRQPRLDLPGPLVGAWDFSDPTEMERRYPKLFARFG